MTCQTCGRNPQWHGSQTGARAGTYLHETGCHDGVRMDDDEHGEGWAPDTIYPPCQFNPARCSTCDGTGNASPMMAEALKRDDCEDCNGTGWKDGECQWPIAVESETETETT